MAVEQKADEARTDQASAPAAPPYRPFWLVALLLLGLIAAVLGAAFLLDRAYRPRVGVVAAPASLATGQPTSVPTTAGALATASPAAPTATAAVAPTPTVAPTMTTALRPSVAPPTAVGKVGAETPAVRATVQPAVEQLTPLEQDVAAAYLRYWGVLWQALYYLDTSRLTEVMADAELASTEEDVRELRAEGHAAYLDVDLNFRITRASPDEAVIYDRYINRSLYMDAATKQKIPTKEPPGVIEVSFQMKRIDGVWKVVNRVRHD